MPLVNTSSQYGSLTKAFHWLTALLILTALPLGFLAHNAPFTDGAEVAHKAWLFSLHKTVGVAAIFTALLRIFWSLGQTRPGLLNSRHQIEATAAHTVHWLLYGSMVLVPLTGWIHHAATTGFAPILWPFGQSLPFVPKSETLAETTSTLHLLFMLTLAGSILAHVAGALKHLVIDRDQTLQRMLPMRNSAPTPEDERSSPAPLLAALAIWGLVLVVGTSAGVFSTSAQNHSEDGHSQAPLATTSAPSNWQVQEGTLTISVHQFGSDVEGRFAEWSSAIVFDEVAVGGKHGTVKTQVAISSLALGSVTEQALEADFLDSAVHSTATFQADILASDVGYLANGALTLKGVTVPLSLPFTLAIEDNTATMSGETILDRRDFGIGTSMADESSLAFSVKVIVSLTASRAP
ncbi:Cytochrome b561 [Shimia gijangensis]|uniref:Cytochrome b561 n=1 Tax=Shimia gijangensis TaxID=1470563 RepID=A0A1M6EEG5_9RHOB|nr:cytochrome b/b6 domain-containing protein [Shimia gijangensis]SHI83813.1 Cytochrome b561 [Shimia gijangensis]